jgi:hypothetical protein
MAKLQLINPQRRCPATARCSESAERSFHFRANPVGANWGGTWVFETD